MTKKICRGCNKPKPLTQFYALGTSKDGREPSCKRCRNTARHAQRSNKADKIAAAIVQDAADRARRVASDHEALKLDDLDGDYDVGVGNVNTPKARRVSAQASRERRQEFNQRMADHAGALKSAAATAPSRGGDLASAMPGDVGTYIAGLAEQERRFGNRRLARTIALAQAGEALSLQLFKDTARQFFSDKIAACGYAKTRPSKPAKRSLVLLLSDLHLGSDLSSLDEPMPFRAVQEARRLEYIMRQAIDYKPQYRENTKLVVLWNGDLIEGQLMHQIGAGAPLAEQKAITWMYTRQMMAEFSRAFPAVECHWQSGNHGRDKVRHPGRATWRKWDGHEFEIGWALKEMCSGLANVTWSLPFRAVSAVELHGAKLLLTHADTELKLGHPDTAAKSNAREIDRVNATRIFGHEFAAAAFGHFHSGRLIYGDIPQIWNGALVPPNGHARANGYIGEAMGQFLWEAVAGYPVGDVRFVRVGTQQDNDERLGTIIKPFRFPTE